MLKEKTRFAHHLRNVYGKQTTVKWKLKVLKD